MNASFGSSRPAPVPHNVFHPRLPVRSLSLALAFLTLAACAGSTSAVEDRGGPCPAGPVFSTPIMPLTDLDHIIPLGSVSPSISRGGHTLPTSHTYWNTRAPGTRAVTLYAPADLRSSG